MPHILVIEDNPSYRKLVTRSLRRERFTIHEADDPEQALKHLARHPIELAILDIGLGKTAAFAGKLNPGVRASGYELLESIRNRPEYVSIIVLTSLSEEIFETACLRRGADDYLLKNVSMTVLTARVECCIRRGNLLRGLAVPTPPREAPSLSLQ